MLILGKPLGIGILSAALKKEVLSSAGYADMLRWTTQLNTPGCAFANMDEVHAVTDVTGFGLAGHLLEICEASNTGATLRLADLPLLPAAEALAEAGEASSLAPQNRAACLGRITGDLSSPRAALLFDPQTCGGLLAAVPAKAAPALLAALPDARAIGEITAGPARIALR